jgi:hypothetical protein
MENLVSEFWNVTGYIGVPTVVSSNNTQLPISGTPRGYLSKGYLAL